MQKIIYSGLFVILSFPSISMTGFQEWEEFDPSKEELSAVNQTFGHSKYPDDRDCEADRAFRKLDVEERLNLSVSFKDSPSSAEEEASWIEQERSLRSQFNVKNLIAQKAFLAGVGIESCKSKKINNGISLKKLEKIMASHENFEAISDLKLEQKQIYDALCSLEKNESSDFESSNDITGLEGIDSGGLDIEPELEQRLKNYNPLKDEALQQELREIEFKIQLVQAQKKFDKRKNIESLDDMSEATTQELYLECQENLSSSDEEVDDSDDDQNERRTGHGFDKFVAYPKKSLVENKRSSLVLGNQSVASKKQKKSESPLSQSLNTGLSENTDKNLLCEEEGIFDFEECDWANSYQPNKFIKDSMVYACCFDQAIDVPEIVFFLVLSSPENTSFSLNGVVRISNDVNFYAITLYDEKQTIYSEQRVKACSIKEAVISFINTCRHISIYDEKSLFLNDSYRNLDQVINFQINRRLQGLSFGLQQYSRSSLGY